MKNTKLILLIKSSVLVHVYVCTYVLILQRFYFFYYYLSLAFPLYCVLYIYLSIINQNIGKFMMTKIHFIKYVTGYSTLYLHA